MIFALLDTVLFPCPRTHKLHLRKFAFGFVQKGYQFIIIKNIEDIKYLGEDDILYVSNHFSVELLHKGIEKYLSKKLFSLLDEAKAKLMLWNFHTTSEMEIWEGLSNKVIHLGENFYNSYVDEEIELSKFHNRYDVFKLKYSSASSPDNLPKFYCGREYDFQFIGSNYKRKLLEHCKANYISNIKIAPPIVNEVYRVNSYIGSNINLVFHSDDNIRKGIVVERFPEALSSGGIIFHDHPRINEEYKSLKSLVYVKTKEDIDNAYLWFRNLAEIEILKLREESFYAWSRSDLSYYEQANKICKLFNK